MLEKRMNRQLNAAQALFPLLANQKTCSFALVFIITVFPSFGDTAENPYIVNIETEYNIVNSIDTGTAYLNKHFINWGDLTPIVMTFVNKDGSVSICSVNSSARETYIYEYTKDLAYIKTMRFVNEFEKFGAFIKDNNGNYYIFSAQDVQEGSFNQNNMALAKYNSNGRRLAVFYLPAQTSDEKWASGYSGVKEPFSTGSCRMEISGNWIAVYFSRLMFIAPDGLNHQASYGFIVNRNNLHKISGIAMPSAGHSFNQFILPVENGFVFADQGDVDPRGFYFSKVQNGQVTRSLSSFVFKQGDTYQNTFAQLGGLAKTPNGYIFAGTYERNTVVSGSHNDSRNLFILTFDNNLTACTRPVWITNYNDKDTDNAASPKITEVDTGCYLLMWERMSRNRYESTYAAIIDENGKLLTPIEQLDGVRLNINDTLRFNRATRSVYWAVNNGNRMISVYAFNLDHLITIESSGIISSRSSRLSAENGSFSPALSFACSFGGYLNGWHESLVSMGLPVQLGIEIGFADMAFALLGEAGIGVGISSFTESKSPLLEWNFGCMGEFYFPGQKIGMGFGGGIADSAVLNISGLPASEAFKTLYLRYAFIFRKKSKFSLYGQQYGDGNWGFGLQWGGFWN